MDKCDQATAAECCNRILRLFPVPAGVDSDSWSIELGNVLMAYPLQATRAATDQAVRSFKRLPAIAQMIELLERETKRMIALATRSDTRNALIPIERQTDAEIVNDLINRAFRAIPWPVMETERAKLLAADAAFEFLQQMDPANDYHVLGFHRLRYPGFLPLTAKLPPLDQNTRRIERAQRIEEILSHHGFGKEFREREIKRRARQTLSKICDDLGVDIDSLPDAPHRK